MVAVTEVGASLSDAVERHVRPATPFTSCWATAGGRRQPGRWPASTGGPIAGFTLIMTSLGALGALFFRGGMLRKVVTAYSGNSFPSYAPNPIFNQAYESGEVALEHWSILTLGQRLEAAARGLPAMVTGSVVGSDLASNPGFTSVDSAFGPVGLLAPLVPDVALLHAALSDAQGNLVVSEPMLEGTWGAWAARRGVVATVERIVDDLEGLGPPGADPRPPGAGGGGGTLRRPPRWLLPAGPSGGRVRRGHPLLGRRRRRRPRRLRWLGTREPARPAGPRRLPRAARGRPPAATSVSLSDPESWRRDAEANPLPATTRHQRLGGCRRRWAPAKCRTVVSAHRRRRRAGRSRGGQPGRLGGGGPGPGGR